MPKDGPNDLDDATGSELQIVRRRVTLISASEEEREGPKGPREDRACHHVFHLRGGTLGGPD